MKIRPLCDFELELPIFLEGAERYTVEGKVVGGFVREKFVRSWKMLMSSRNGTQAIVLGAFGQDGIMKGAIAGVVSEGLQNHHLTAMESFWYVPPENRHTGLGKGIAIRLFKAFEERAIELGAKTILTSNRLSLQPEELAGIYQRMGYHPLETYYAKDL